MDQDLLAFYTGFVKSIKNKDQRRFLAVQSSWSGFGSCFFSSSRFQVSLALVVLKSYNPLTILRDTIGKTYLGLIMSQM
jgi:hypothetical protein